MCPWRLRASDGDVSRLFTGRWLPGPRNTYSQGMTGRLGWWRALFPEVTNGSGKWRGYLTGTSNYYVGGTYFELVPWLREGGYLTCKRFRIVDWGDLMSALRNFHASIGHERPPCLRWTPWWFQFLLCKKDPFLSGFQIPYHPCMVYVPTFTIKPPKCRWIFHTWILWDIIINIVFWKNRL